MTRWASEGVEALTDAEAIRRDLNNRARGANAILADPAAQDAFIQGAGAALDRLRAADTRRGAEDGATAARLHRAESIAQAAARLQAELARLTDPEERATFEGAADGTGLVSVAEAALDRLQERAQRTRETFGNARGAQPRGPERAAVVALAQAWRDAFQLEPVAKGAFGAILALIFSLHNIEPPAPNTLRAWLRGQ